MDSICSLLSSVEKSSVRGFFVGFCTGDWLVGGVLAFCGLPVVSMLVG